MKIISVVGARPNFIKIAPIHRVINNHNKEVENLICHTGQHFDNQMSSVFFNDLELPEPDFYLGVGSGSHAEQTAKIMIEFEKVMKAEVPDLVIVVGDVNSSLACSIVASKLGVRIAHVEAGLRSFDRTMPEEINRVVIDSLSDLLFVTEKSGLENLKNEGISTEKIYFTGNVMIDSLIFFLTKMNKSHILDKFNLNKSDYILSTIHRPSNVDSKESMEKIIEFLNEISLMKKVIFSVHPRTKLNLIKNKLKNKLSKNIIFSEPIGYIDFLCLMKNSSIVITDSGGIQEETTFLGVQCMTLRDNTERPITVESGTNRIIGSDLNKAKETVQDVLGGNIIKGKIPELWDGKSAERIVKIILDAF